VTRVNDAFTLCRIRVEVASTEAVATSTHLVFCRTNSRLNLLSTSTWKHSRRSDFYRRGLDGLSANGWTNCTIQIHEHVGL